MSYDDGDYMKTAIFCLAGALAAQAGFAQSNDKALVNELVKHWQTSKALTLAVANAMPESDYGFKASAPEMSFGEQMNHIAMGDEHYCAAAFGEKSDMEKPGDNSKATATKSITTAFDYCLAGIEKMTDADLQKEIEMQSKPVTKFELLWGGFTHAAHHRGQAEVYLRLKGITPPSYKF